MLILKKGVQYIRRDGLITSPLILSSYKDVVTLFCDKQHSRVYTQNGILCTLKSDSTTDLLFLLPENLANLINLKPKHRLTILQKILKLC